jgi:hypothetical protein
MGGDLKLLFTHNLGAFEFFPQEAHLYDAFGAKGVNVGRLRKMRFRSSTQPIYTRDRETLAAMSGKDLHPIK